MAHALGKALGLKEVRLELNSLGQPPGRKQHRAALIAYFEQHLDKLDEDAKRRLHSNPLRILDSKNPAMKALNDAAPKLLDFLGPESLAQFNAVIAMPVSDIQLPLQPKRDDVLPVVPLEITQHLHHR